LVVDREVDASGALRHQLRLAGFHFGRKSSGLLRLGFLECLSGGGIVVEGFGPPLQSFSGGRDLTALPSRKAIGAAFRDSSRNKTILHSTQLLCSTIFLLHKQTAKHTVDSPQSGHPPDSGKSLT
jgi:hypothetical protein